jgi:large subunit ribosomal protein L18
MTLRRLRKRPVKQLKQQQARLKMKTKPSDKIEKNKSCLIKVNRTNRFIYGQIVDIESGKTIVSYSSLKIKGNLKPVEKAEMIGEKLASLIKSKYNKFIFDRNKFIYHGQIKSLADGLRKGGIKF